MLRTLLNFFVPRKENGFIPHSLSLRAIVVYLLIAVFIKALSFLAGTTVPATRLFADVSSQFVIALTNQERQAQGLQPLAENQFLDKAACQKAQDMVQNKYFAHTSPQGIDPWYWFRQAGYQYANAGENLAIDFYESEDLMRAWVNSPSHRKNLLGNYSDIGLCVLQGNVEGYDSTVVVQFFATPKASARAQSIPTPMPSLKPSVSPRPSASRAPLANATPARSPVGRPIVEGALTGQPSPLASASATQRFAGTSGQTNGIAMSLLKEKPLAFGNAWDALMNPFWLYAGFLAYLVSVLAVGAFARAATPNPKALAGVVAVILVVVGMMSLPSTPDVLRAQARVLPPLTTQVIQ